jgi:hypothetical protein
VILKTGAQRLSGLARSRRARAALALAVFCAVGVLLLSSRQPTTAAD